MSEKSRIDWFPVARWEFLRMIRKKDFLITAFLTPALMIGAGFIVAWVQERNEDQLRRVAVVQLDPAGAGQARDIGELEHFEWVTVSGEDATPEGLVTAVRNRELDGAVILPADFPESTGVQLVVLREGPGWKRALREHLSARARAERAERAGLPPAQLQRLEETVSLNERVAEEGRGTTKGDRLAASALMFLLLITIFFNSMYVAYGITGEKQQRVSEVVLSAIRPQAWVDGKLAAYTALGITQAVIWGASLSLAAILLSWRLPPSVNPLVALVAVAFTAVGFVLFLSLFAVVAATIKDMQSSSKAQTYLIMLPMLPIFFLEPAVENPEAIWVMVMSWVPLFSPVLMPMRFTVGGAAMWELLLAMALLVLAANAMRLAAGHALRIGMLMYGKEITLPELVRWARSR